MANVTELLDAIQQGQPQAAEELLPLVYDELRRLARVKLVQEKPGQTLQATALVHEAYLRLVGRPGDRGQETGDSNSSVSCSLSPVSFSSRGHFFAAAAEAMRRILVEAARRKKRLKRGGDRDRQPLEEDQIAAPEEAGDLIELDAALDKLAAKDPRKAELVKLRYFAGLTQEQTAEALGIGVSTADRDWAYARAWLFREMKK
jgi:RNA polymerase sigma factor (sigma-70 family)